ncbi:hypothetical protein B0H16DRAFT_1344256 [Mycena metata]|uniref:Integrase core domain-containing protein n=1 Tax=Mycena metata TaxID=1033252 RepID=A0AAD7H228_9AGAR|nr:hypothetical protein B0H16DRAFT_1344256 [Mycena metata]
MCGVLRGSYIWGRSVHNTWMECLWYNITHGFGHKWKTFFTELEVHQGLNPLVPSHIWLLHHLFLDAINRDAQEWATAWNSHHLQIRGEHSRSPRDMYIFSMLQDGPHGLEYTEPADETVNDPTTYGIDYDVADNPALMAHLLDENPLHLLLGTTPSLMFHAPDSPFDAGEIAALDTQLAAEVDVLSRNMQIHQLVWVKAMEICNSFYE